MCDESIRKETGLPTEDELVIGQPFHFSDPELWSAIEYNATQSEFKDMAFSRDVKLFAVDSCPHKTDGKWDFKSDKDLLFVGYDLTLLSKTYNVCPEIAHLIVDYAILHERGHLERHSVDKIMREQFEIAVAAYGKGNFYRLSEDEQNKFVVNAIYSSDATMQQERQANYNAIIDQVNSGVSMGRLAKKIAAGIWYIEYYWFCEELDSMPYDKREEKIRTDLEYFVESYFPRLVPKKDIIEKVVGIEREYRNRLGKITACV